MLSNASAKMYARCLPFSAFPNCQAVAAADSEEAARRQGEALTQRLAHLSTKLTEAEEERRAELAPGLRTARDDVAVLRCQLEAERARAGVAQREAAQVAAKLEAVSGELEQGTVGTGRTAQ